MYRVPKIPSRKVYTPPKITGKVGFYPNSFNKLSIRFTPQSITKLKNIENFVSNIFKVDAELKLKAQSYGFYKFIMEETDILSLGKKISFLEPTQISSISSVLENPKTDDSSRAAYIIKNYVEFFYNIQIGKIKPLELKIEYPNIEIFGEDDYGYLALFKDGYITRIKEDVIFGKKDLRKKGWSKSKASLDAEILYQLFLNRLIYAHRDCGYDPGYLDCIFIKCSTSFALNLLNNGFDQNKKTWFSTSFNYSKNFVNKSRTLNYRLRNDKELKEYLLKYGLIEETNSNLSWVISPFDIDLPESELKSKAEMLWISDPTNHMLLKIKLNNENYKSLLLEFKKRIMERRIEGLHQFGNANLELDWLIVKFDKNTPTFAINPGNPLINPMDIYVIE